MNRYALGLLLMVGTLVASNITGTGSRPAAVDGVPYHPSDRSFREVAAKDADLGRMELSDRWSTGASRAAAKLSFLDIERRMRSAVMPVDDPVSLAPDVREALAAASRAVASESAVTDDSASMGTGPVTAGILLREAYGLKTK